MKISNSNQLADELIEDSVTIGRIFGGSNGNYFKQNGFTKFMQGIGDWHQRQFIDALNSMSNFQLKIIKDNWSFFFVKIIGFTPRNINKGRKDCGLFCIPKECDNSLILK